jgi:hypothetical protein
MGGANKTHGIDEKYTENISKKAWWNEAPAWVET